MKYDNLLSINLMFIQKGQLFHYDPGEHRTDSEIYLHSYFHPEEYWGKNLLKLAEVLVDSE